MVYATPLDIYSLTSLTEDDINLVDLTTFITYATAVINSDINIIHDDEKVQYLSPEKQNKIDGSNTIFYTIETPIGDRTNSGTSNVLDIVAYTINNSVRTAYSVSTLDDDELGKFTLTSAPSTSESLYISYVSSPVEIATPNILVKLATVYLVAALANTKITADKFKSLKLGRLSTVKFESEYTKNLNLYLETIQKINDKKGLIDIIEGDSI